MDNYTKLFSSIITSTIWQEDNPTRILWITMLALSDADGMVDGSIPGLARLAGITVEDCEKAMAKLQSPDPYSRTKEHEGRRVGDVDGGWIILNRSKYRDKKVKRTDYHREYMRRYRTKNDVNNNVNNCKQKLTQKEKEKEKEKEVNETNYMSIFDEARKLYPGTKRGLTPEYENFTKKNKAYREIINLLTPAIKKEIDHKRKLKETGRFCPEWKNFSTWINKESWTQELPEIELPEGYCPTRAITEEEAQEIFG